MGRNRSSVKNQVVQALRTIDKIGTSKRQARKAGDRTGIHGTTYKVAVQGSAIRFVQYAKENHGIKTLFQLRPEHHKSYMTHLASKGLSKGYMVNMESHLQKLQTGMAKMSENLKKPPITFFEGRTISPGEKEGSRDRSYTREEIEAMFKHMSKMVATAARMGYKLGLRNREVCNLRVEHVQQREDGRLEIRIENGRGITKGGRFRNVPVSQRYENELRGLIISKLPEDRIIPLSETTMRNGVAVACRKAGIESRGTHGFRHTYARERVQELIQERIPDQKAEVHWMLKRLVKNYHGEQRMDSGIGRDLYDDIKGIVDTVLSELGHGEGRWDLLWCISDRRETGGKMKFKDSRSTRFEPKVPGTEKYFFYLLATIAKVDFQRKRCKYKVTASYGKTIIIQKIYSIHLCYQQFGLAAGFWKQNVRLEMGTFLAKPLTLSMKCPFLAGKK
ncbi:tyrosine-type recombinase/integrase [Brevibacillus choshinensis]|uniref:Tyrosine-type recombinase/integrase n=1 Tax=Brevibacillus choshinensis TaxID=54911 RepID=A0ABX7FNB9_BRECH|nr:tyrosine-type recombinase/integrase [Brevibacillus choshinensis]QRG67335.1 tyrosine-type recombinase/integrase [Brevibacillus choshinensis]